MIRQHRKDFWTCFYQHQLDFLRIHAIAFGQLRQHISNLSHQLDAGQTATANQNRRIGRIVCLRILTNAVFNMRMNVFGVSGGFQHHAILFQSRNAEISCSAAQRNN
ncbi:hypothetical protein D3C75_1104990 [compost metagenome]